MESNLTDYHGKTDGDRTVMHVLYGLHTLAWFSGGQVPLDHAQEGQQKESHNVHGLMVAGACGS